MDLYVHHVLAHMMYIQCISPPPLPPPPPSPPLPPPPPPPLPPPLLPRRRQGHGFAVQHAVASCGTPPDPQSLCPRGYSHPPCQVSSLLPSVLSLFTFFVSGMNAHTHTHTHTHRVVNFHQQNKMSYANLALVFGPTLIRPKPDRIT